MRANPGGEIDQNEVVGRDSFIEAFWGVLAHQSVLLLSERRFGKTTVIKKMKAEHRADWLLLWRDVEGISTALEFAERVFRDIEEYLSKSKRFASKTRAVIDAMGGVEIGGVFKLPPASKLPWKTLLEKAFEDLMEARDSRVVFFWDEMPFMIQKIHDKEGAPAAMEILDSLRGIRQTHRHVRMVFCGSIGMHHVINALQKSGHTNPALNDLFTMPLPPLTSNDGAELARRLIQGESLPCEDLDSTTRALAEAVDCVPFYIHSVVKELATRRVAVTPDGVNTVVDHSFVTAHDPWHLRHFEDRLGTYYGVERESVAGALLDELAVASQPLRLQDLQQSIASNSRLAPGKLRAAIRSGDMKPLRELLEDLSQDHYISQLPGTGRYVFQFPLIKKWWSVRRGLL